MSARRRSRKHRRSSPPSSTTVSAAASIATPETVEVATADPKIEIEYARTDEEVCAIHRFLMIVAEQAGALRCPVDIYDSLDEIVRVAKEDAAIMVLHNGVMVGTMGLMKARWWYNKKHFFLTDRWHFVLPAFMHTPTATRLMDEAKAIARIAGLPFVHNGKLREEKDGVSRLTPRLHLPAIE